jgi:hypothetical protein
MFESSSSCHTTRITFFRAPEDRSASNNLSDLEHRETLRQAQGRLWGTRFMPPDVALVE